MITLKNQYLVASLAEKGAELQRLYSKETEIEYLWNANPDYWAKHSPILFPIVGSLKDGRYDYNGNSYTLPRHGFARDHVFESKQISDTEALFSLHESEDTLAVYPFNFLLNVRYTLIERKICVTYEVKNTGKAKMLFSLGAHPAFAIPNTPDTNYEDYYLAFNEDEKLTIWTLDDGLVTDKTETLDLNNHKLKLEHNLFKNDALIFKTLQSSCISLLNTKNDFGLHFHFEHFPYFGIWAAPDAPFVCLEPWCGIADGINHDQSLPRKEGVISLSAGKIWSRFWEVECF